MASLYRQFRNFGHHILYAPGIKQILTRLPLTHKLYPSWELKHPIDLSYGIETSGFVPVEKLHSDPKLTALINPYGASQPSLIRRALSALGNVEGYALVDLGCGKGRVTVIGSEFGFREIIGVELSAALAKIARANAAVVARSFPRRPAIQIFEANVLDFSYPAGKLVLFTYHAFGAEILSALIKKLEARLNEGLTHLFVVYYNPVHGNLFDASPHFKRWYAEMLTYVATELRYGPGPSETVVIWQSVAGALPSPYQNIDRGIVVSQAFGKADLA